MNRKTQAGLLIAAGVYTALVIIGQATVIEQLNRKVSRLTGANHSYKVSFDLALNEMTPDQLMRLRSKMETHRDFINITRNL